MQADRDDVELQTPLSLGSSTDGSDPTRVEDQEVPIPFTSSPEIQELNVRREQEPESQDRKVLWLSLLVENDDSWTSCFPGSAY